MRRLLATFRVWRHAKGPHVRKMAIITSILLAGLCSALINPLGTNAQSVGFWNKGCKKALVEVKKKPPHRAFAVSSDAQIQGGQACGWTWSNPSKSAAERNALESCRKQQYGGSNCRVIYSE